MVTNLLLISIASILTFSLLDRCKLYNIDPKDCQNSVYIPDSSYDEYLKSFNIPIQKDPECNKKKNCVIVVYKDPARISVNATHNLNNQGCHLGNAADCIPNIQNNTLDNSKQQGIQTKEPPLIFQKTVYVDSENEQKGHRKKHSQEDSDNEDNEKKSKNKNKTITETVTQSIPISSTSEENSTIHQPNCDKPSEKRCQEKYKGINPPDSNEIPEKVPKTVTIHDINTTESSIATISHKPETVIVHERFTRENSQTSETTKPKTVTIYERYNPEGPDRNTSQKQEESTVYEQKTSDPPAKVVTISIKPEIQSSILTNSETTPRAIETEAPTAKRPCVPMSCNKKDSSIDKNDVQEKFAELKTMLRDKICKHSPEKDECQHFKKECSNECESDSSFEHNKNHKNKKRKKEKDEDDSEENTKRPKKKKTKETASVITVTRMSTITVTDEIPVTLYREIEKIITKDNIVTKFKVKTEYKTVSVDRKSPEPPEMDTEAVTKKTVSPTVAIPIITSPPENNSTAQIPQTSSESIQTAKPHLTLTPDTAPKNEHNSFFEKYFNKFMKSIDQKEMSEKESENKNPPLIPIPLVPSDPEEPHKKTFSEKREQNTISCPIIIADPKNTDLEREDITQKNKPIGDELSRSLIPLFGKFLEKITQDSLLKVKKDEDSAIAKPDIKTVFLTTTEFVTETIRRPNSTCLTQDPKSSNKPEKCKNNLNKCVIKDTDANNNIPKKPKTVYNTVYKTAPMKMKCRPVFQNKVNCMIIKEGTVFKTIQDGKEEVEKSKLSPKKSSEESKENEETQINRALPNQ